MAVPATNPMLQGGNLAYGFQQVASPGAPGIAAVDTESLKNTYSYTTASMVLQAAPADIFQLAGAASIVTRIKRIWAQVGSTVSGKLNLQVIKRSTGSTGGTSASGTLSKYDSGDATNSSLVTVWTANPSATGTTISSMFNFMQPVNAAATPQQAPSLLFSIDNAKALVLRGAAEFLVINGSLSTLTNADNAITLNVEFTEEAG